MKIAFKKEVLFVFDLTEEHKRNLRDLGYSFVDTTAFGNEVWEKIDNYFIDSKEKIKNEGR